MELTGVENNPTPGKMTTNGVSIYFLHAEATGFGPTVCELCVSFLTENYPTTERLYRAL